MTSTSLAPAALIGTLLLLALALPASGEEFRFQPSAGLQTEVNDNPSLVSQQDAQSVVGLSVDVGLQASLAGPAWQLNFSPRVIARRYSGQNDLDSRDLLLQMGYNRSLERGNYAVDASYTRQYTLTSQIAATGAVDQNVPQNALSLGISGDRFVTERWSLQGGLSTEDVSYPDGAEVGLYDYRYWLAVGAADVALSPRTSVRFIGRFARFDSTVTEELTSREYTAGIGLDHAWSENWRVNLNAGPSFSTINGRDRGTGTSYVASLDGNWERSSVSLSVQHVLSPSASQGRLQVSDSVSAAYRHRLRESMAASAFVRTVQYSDQDGVPAALQDSFGISSAGVSLDGEIGRSLAWRLAYLHVVWDSPGSPRSNSLSAGVTWRGLARSNSY